MELDLETMPNEDRKALLMRMLVYVEFDQDNQCIHLVGTVEGIETPKLLGEQAGLLKL